VSATVQRRWSDVMRDVFALRAGVNLSVPKSAVVHPRDLEPVFRASTGLHQEGVIAHWRCRTENDRCIHALETSDAFLVHWDRVDPNASLLGPLSLQQQYNKSVHTVVLKISLRRWYFCFFITHNKRPCASIAT
jgi:hypothetical protein